MTVCVSAVKYVVKIARGGVWHRWRRSGLTLCGRIYHGTMWPVEMCPQDREGLTCKACVAIEARQEKELATAAA